MARCVRASRSALLAASPRKTSSTRVLKDAIFGSGARSDRGFVMSNLKVIKDDKENGRRVAGWDLYQANICQDKLALAALSGLKLGVNPSLWSFFCHTATLLLLEALPLTVARQTAIVNWITPVSIEMPTASLRKQTEGS